MKIKITGNKKMIFLKFWDQDREIQSKINKTQIYIKDSDQNSSELLNGNTVYQLAIAA